MGFGLLFIGFFIAYLGSLSGVISAFTYALGAAIILFALIFAAGMIWGR